MTSKIKNKNNSKCIEKIKNETCRKNKKLKKY